MPAVCVMLGRSRVGFDVVNMETSDLIFAIKIFAVQLLVGF